VNCVFVPFPPPRTPLFCFVDLPCLLRFARKFSFFLIPPSAWLFPPWPVGSIFYVRFLPPVPFGPSRRGLLSELDPPRCRLDFTNPRSGQIFAGFPLDSRCKRVDCVPFRTYSFLFLHFISVFLHITFSSPFVGVCFRVSQGCQTLKRLTDGLWRIFADPPPPRSRLALRLSSNGLRSGVGRASF